MSTSNASQFYAQTYDESVPDWPGEIDFYRELAAKLKSSGGSLLEVACGTGLEGIQRHLTPGGALVVHLDHQDIGWLGDLVSGKGGVFEAPEQVHHPLSGRLVRKFQAWIYEPATHSAFSQVAWEEVEEVAEDGQVVERWQDVPVRLHCVFRLARE